MSVVTVNLRPNIDVVTAVAMGLLNDGVTAAGSSYGYVATNSTASWIVRATAYVPQGVNAQRSFKSTSANDAAVGTGARTVTLNYLTAAFVLKSETVTLNGVTAVATVGTDIAYIESIVVASVGSNDVNVGTINFYTDTTGGGGGGTVWGSIAVGDNQTFWAHHYVPTGSTCFPINFTVGATAESGRSNLVRSGDPTSLIAPKLQVGMAVTYLSSTLHKFDVPTGVVGPDLIWLISRPDRNTASTTVAGFEYIQFAT